MKWNRKMQTNLNQILTDLDSEILRTKLWLNNFGYNHGTAVWHIVYKYRKELKEYRKLVSDDIHFDQVEKYD